MGMGENSLSPLTLDSTTTPSLPQTRFSRFALFHVTLPCWGKLATKTDEINPGISETRLRKMKERSKQSGKQCLVSLSVSFQRNTLFLLPLFSCCCPASSELLSLSSQIKELTLPPTVRMQMIIWHCPGTIMLSALKRK